MTSPLDPEHHRELVLQAKKQLRRQMRTLRTAHPKKGIEERSSAICRRLMEEASEKEGIALFWPMEGRNEVDLRAFDSALRERGGVRIYYPFMEPSAGGGYTTGFRLTKSQTDLRERGRGFFEPSPSAPTATPGQIDLVLVPALAADERGHRVGYGAGYYDATLGDVCPPAEAWIVAFQFQLLSELPTEEHDVACDAVLSDQRFYRVP